VETWRQLSEDSLLAAEALLQEGRYRSCISRAYYAAYCAATHEIVQKLTTFSYGRRNPSHELVPAYIRNNLTISQAKKDVISTLTTVLRLYREDADYRPHTSLDKQIARECIRAAAEVQQELWGISK
jgi:uncharacterized protein (UPF0332 family)